MFHPPLLPCMNTYKQSLYVAIVRIVANLAMIGAVFLAMYQASHRPAWPSEAVFCVVFFGITIPVWLIAWRMTRWIRTRWPGPASSLVQLPHLGEQLVTWQVSQNPFPSSSPRLPNTPAAEIQR